MQLFVLHRDIEQNVRWHTDAHVIKIILEGCQLLSTSRRLQGSTNDLFYKPTYQRHPLVKWLYKPAHEVWAASYVLALGREYTYRYGKVHKCIERFGTWLQSVVSGNREDSGCKEVQHIKCFKDDKYKSAYEKKDVVEAYQCYYSIRQHEWSRKPTWKNRTRPCWL